MGSPRKGLRYQRELAGKTIIEAGNVVGVSPSHYSKMERGLSELTLERAADLARWLGCTIEDLL